jgi:hypothetical protein
VLRLLVDHLHQGGLRGVQARWVRAVLGGHDRWRVDLLRPVKVLVVGPLWLNLASLLPVQVHGDLLRDLAVALDVAVRPVVRKVTNRGLTALSPSSRPSQESIWDVLALADSRDDCLLWLHFGVLLVHIHSQVKGALSREAALPLYHLSGILDRKDGPWLDSIGLPFLRLVAQWPWLAAEVTLSLVIWIGLLLLQRVD